MKSMPFLLVLLLFCSTSFTSYARQKRVSQERFKQMRDSMLKVSKKKSYETAIARYKSLKANTRKDTLKVVDLSDLHLKEFPLLVFEFPNLTKLDISNNQFIKLPKKLKELDSLKTMIWISSEFDQSNFSDKKIVRKLKFPRKTNIEKLYLSNNDLIGIPKSINKLRNLKFLSVSENKIKTDGGRLKKLTKLKTLNLDGNPIDIHSMRFDKFSSTIEMLKMNKCGLTEITADIYNLRIEDLQFRENKLKKIPSGISKMSTLRKLSFYKNNLESLPEDIYDLDRLESLDLYYNQLNEVSPRIAEFDSLSILYLAYNKLYDVPVSIGEMKQLKELYLHHNQLNSLPESFDGLKSIKTLRLNDNNMPEFPNAILSMRKLEFLDISSNLLETLPIEIGTLSNLKLFTYDKNQIDFEAASNRHVVSMVSDMVERGVVCDPTVSKSYVQEGN